MRMRRNILYVVFGIVASMFILLVGSFYLPKHASSLSTQSLTNEEYDELSRILTVSLTQHDPRFAIEDLKERTVHDPRIARVCHELLHEMGRSALTHYENDFARAMSYQDEFCVSGYIHGVIEEYFKETKDVRAVMSRACVAYTSRSFMEWECYHGIGHGLMFYSQNDVPGSLTNCRTYKDDWIASACANGVYMENFNADERLHKSTFVRPEDPFFPCNTDVLFKRDCYMGAPIYYLSQHEDNYDDALLWCGSAPEENAICAYGVGAQAARRNIGKLDMLVNVCRGAPVTLRTSCVTGLATGIVSHYHSRVEASQFCSTMDFLDQRACKNAVSAALL